MRSLPIRADSTAYLVCVKDHAHHDVKDGLLAISRLRVAHLLQSLQLESRGSAQTVVATVQKVTHVQQNLTRETRRK